jgi:hypothetical protein
MNRKTLSGILITVAFMLGFLLKSWNVTPEEDIRADERKKNQQEINRLKYKLGLQVEIMEEMVDTMLRMDTIITIEKQNRIEAQQEAIRQRELRKKELRMLSDKEKEELIIKRYEKDPADN